MNLQVPKTPIYTKIQNPKTPTTKQGLEKSIIQKLFYKM